MGTKFMARQRHLNNAPIQEAIIDIRTKLNVNLNREKILSLKDQLHERYPQFEEIREFESYFEVIDGKKMGQSTQDKGVSGYLFKSKDEKCAFQFRNDGFTFNKLKPYTTWDDVISKTRNIWDTYIKNSDIERVIRIAIRYINQLDIPLPINDFKDFLTKPPDVPDEVPDAISSFLSRVVLHDVENSISANITQALGKNIKPEYANIIIDIDVYKNVDIQFTKYDEIWGIFEQLHKLKNTIFFNSITEKTAGLFE